MKRMRLPWAVVLVVLAAGLLDAGFTLFGQPAAYWSDYAKAREWNPLGHALLTRSPFLFAAAAAVGLPLLALAMRKLPLVLATMTAVVFFTGFADGASSWVDNILLGKPSADYWMANSFSWLPCCVAGYIVFLVLARLSRRAAVALLASALFLICEDHGMTVGWIATITDLMCVLFLNLALLLHIVARQDGRLRYFALSLVFALAAVTSKETAFVYPALVGSYELFFAGADGNELRGLSLRRRLGFFARRWWAWAAPAALFALYVVFYREVVPPMRNLMYQDPLGDPLGYAGAMIVNLPVMFAGLLTQFLPSIATRICYVVLQRIQVMITVSVPMKRRRRLFRFLWEMN